MLFEINYDLIHLLRDLNPGPLAPKARIIPLDQQAFVVNCQSSVEHRALRAGLLRLVDSFFLLLKYFYLIAVATL